MAVESERPALCVFEHIYFSRPDTKLEGRTLQSVRGRMGEILAREAPVDADLVISVPDSGNAAAKGFARGSGIPQDDGLIKNRYVARTFIQPGQELRHHGLRMKFNPLPEVVSGKRLVVVDDSIVRGNTMRQIVRMLREAGATEVHLRMSSPPIRHPCHYGVDMPTQRGDDRQRAHRRGGRRGARRRLARLPVAGGRLRGGRLAPREHCDACFTGDYPLEGEHQANGKHALEELAASYGPETRLSHRGSRLGLGDEPAGDPRRVHGPRRHRGRGRGRNSARRAGARAGREAGVETAVFEAADYADRAERDRAMAGYPEERGVRAGGARRVHASARRPSSWPSSRTP